MEQRVEVLLPLAFDHGFDYLVPVGMTLEAGDIVAVPFGKSETLGVVWGRGVAAIEAKKLKPISKHYSEFPGIPEKIREFIDWSAWYNCALRGGMLKMLLPLDEINKKGRAHIDTDIDFANINLAPLSEAQAQAANELRKTLEQGFSVTLLDGVTGSGKTEVYFDSIAQILGADVNCKMNEPSAREAAAHASNGTSRSGATQMLILLPEIALSVQWLERFEARFGFKPIVWHSEITPAKKRISWQKIASGEARVIVGARSALFLPYRNLKLLIVDEEHDASYKQEEGVHYHARDMAVARARFEQIPLLLVSATPSLESYQNVKLEKYKSLSLPMRHAEATLPEIEMLDMRKTMTERGNFISDPLRVALAQAVASGYQAMLFLNRRGYAPLVLCRACGHRFQCPHCTSWLVMHKSRPRLECHHCGLYISIPKQCPSCQAEEQLHPCGPGVERLFDELSECLPQARVSVMASDSTTSYRELAQTIEAMGKGEIDILIGTQMMAKGHHFPKLALVGVVDADLGLAGGDLRASERTYQLLHQLSGRAGREQLSGKVFLQSFLPEHPVMKALLSGDREAFFAAELQARENAHMPPFSRLAAMVIEGEKEEQVIQIAKELAKIAQPRLSKAMHLYGPAPAPLYLLRNKYRYRLLLKADRSVNLPEFMKELANSCKPPASVKVKIDIDPMSFV